VDGRGSIAGRSCFSSPQRPDRFWGPSSLLSHGYRESFLWMKRSVSEADHSPPSSAEVKNGGAIPPRTPYIPWHNAKLMKHRGDFILTLYIQNNATSEWKQKAEILICKTSTSRSKGGLNLALYTVQATRPRHYCDGTSR
jgi:hypothetical protein